MGEAPGKRDTSGPLGVVGPLHILGVLGDGMGKRLSIEGVFGPPWLAPVVVGVGVELVVVVVVVVVLVVVVTGLLVVLVEVDVAGVVVGTC